MVVTSDDSTEEGEKDEEGIALSSSPQITEQQQHGTEVSWPMQRHAAASAVAAPYYRRYMQGCYDAYSQEKCDQNEADRIKINANQPVRVPRNFTAAGYAKVPAPLASFTALRQFWDAHYYYYSTAEERDAMIVTEDWDEANVYTNHWEAPTSVLRVDAANNKKYGMSVPQRRKLVEEVQAVLEQWTGVPLQPTSLYGIRSYAYGSILAPHVDRYVRRIAVVCSFVRF